MRYFAVTTATCKTDWHLRESPWLSWYLLPVWHQPGLWGDDLRCSLLPVADTEQDKCSAWVWASWFTETKTCMCKPNPTVMMLSCTKWGHPLNKCFFLSQALMSIFLDSFESLWYGNDNVKPFFTFDVTSDKGLWGCYGVKAVKVHRTKEAKAPLKSQHFHFIFLCVVRLKAGFASLQVDITANAALVDWLAS